MSYLYKIHIHIQIRPHILLHKRTRKNTTTEKSLFHTLSTLVSTQYTTSTLVLVHAQVYPGRNSAKMTVTASANASAIATGK